MRQALICEKRGLGGGIVFVCPVDGPLKQASVSGGARDKGAETAGTES